MLTLAGMVEFFIVQAVGAFRSEDITTARWPTSLGASRMQFWNTAELTDYEGIAMDFLHKFMFTWLDADDHATSADISDISVLSLP